MTLLQRLAGRRRAIASGTVVTVAAAGVLVAIMTADGFPAADVDLNDAGIWVTKGDTLMLGRFNRQVDQLDAAVPIVQSRDFDVLQSDATVLVRDDEAGKLVAVDPAYVRGAGQTDLAAASRIGLGGGTSALLDHTSGKLWARPGTSVVAVKPEEDPPDAEVGPDAAVTVGLDGAVHAVSGATGAVVTLPAPGAAAVEEKPLDGARGAKKLALTSVGGVVVGLDPDAQRLLLPGAKPVELAAFGAHPVLQQSGPAAQEVLVATDDALIAVPLDGGEPQRLADGTGAPSAPVRLGSCVHGIWSKKPAYARACGGEPATVRDVPGVGAGAHLVFRVNRGQIVLNDLVTGAVWLLEDLSRVDNWQDLQPKEERETDEEETDADVPQTRRQRSTKNHPPTAQNDRFGARPGQSAVLRVLENDTDPDGDVLALPALPKISGSQGKLDLIDNGQALQFTPAPGAEGEVRFSYTVTDGRGGSDSASVTVQLRPSDQNAKPRVKPGRTSVVQVEVGKQVSYDVLADWEDPDGDPLALVAASSGTADTVRFTAGGLITYVDAGVQQGRKRVEFFVSDGNAQAVSGKLIVVVKPKGNLPPVTRDDLFVARAGQETILRPLLNDIDANSDPLILMSVSNAAGAQVRADPATGTVRFSAARAGSYLLDYKITDGPSVAEGLIRVDVRAAEGNAPPVAVADSLSIPEGGNGVVDVLANDLDLDGDVLVVRSVSQPTSSAVRLSVLDLHIVRVEVDRPLDRPMTLTYEVSDGLASAEGTITIRTVASARANQPPLVAGDTAVVRAGDIVTVPVLKNDSDPDGDRLSLSPQLTVRGTGGSGGAAPADKGLLFTDGEVLRFQAPNKATSVTAIYTAVDARGSRSSGQVTISVRARDDKRNQPPAPPSVEARALAGSTIRIKVPVLGIDPDGDSVTVLGVASAPRLGRVTAVEDGTTLVYQAFDKAAGTDAFSFAVQDSRGARANASVRVGVVPRPDADQPPVAIDDLVTIRPGKELAAPVLANDSDPDGDPIGFDPDQPFTAPEAVKAKLLGDRIAMTVPETAGSLTVPYSITDGRGGRDSAFLTVQVDPLAPALAPIARDDVVPDLADATKQADGTVTTVDVLSNDDDPDGVREDLAISLVGPNAGIASVVNGKVVVKLAPQAQVVAYRVTDVDKLAATAFVQVPGLDVQAPRLRDPGTVLKATAGKPLTIKLADHVVDPVGKPVRLTRAEAVSATSGDGSPLVRNATTLVFTADANYTGPAAITFEVTNGTGPDDPDGRTSILTLPIDVTSTKNSPPTLAAATLKVAPGEAAISVDLKEFAQDPDPGDKGKLRFTAPTGAPGGVSVKLSGSRLSVSAETDTPKGTLARLATTVSDGNNKPVAGTVTVEVTGSTRAHAKANTDVVPDAQQGKKVTIAVLENDANPFPDTPLTLVSVASAGEAGLAEVTGDTVSFTPSTTFVGTAQLSYVVADATGDPDREVTGRITVNVRGVPAKPAAPPTVTDSGDEFVTLRLSAPADNGAPITSYEVAAENGFEAQCATDLCTIDGLTNGTPYRFHFRAVNLVGAGGWSDYSTEIVPDVVPDAPSPPTAAAVDGGEGRQIRLTWSAPTNRGTAIQKYVVTLSPPGSSGATVESAGTELTIDGLTNGTPYTFTVSAVNGKGPGPASAPSAPEIPAGVPGTPAAPSATNSGGALGGQVAVTWTEPATNGAAISAYTLQVFKNGSLVQTLTATGTQQSITADNASDYTFDVTATNKSGTSPASARSAAVRVFGAPFRVGTVTATADDRQATISFSAPNDNGKAITRYDYRVNGGAWTTVPGNRVIGGLANGTAYAFEVRACNDYCGDPSAASAGVTPFGPLGAPSVSTGLPAGNVVRFSWNAPPANGRGVARSQISVNGGGWQNVAASGSWDSPTGFNKSYTISVRSVDDGGLAGAAAGSSNATETSYIRVSRGALKKIPECQDNSCGYVRVQLYNFDPGTYSAVISATRAPSWGSYSISVGSDGYGIGDNRWVYGYPGRQVWVDSDGFRSPDFTWPN